MCMKNGLKQTHQGIMAITDTLTVRERPVDQLSNTNSKNAECESVALFVWIQQDGHTHTNTLSMCAKEWIHKYIHPYNFQSLKSRGEIFLFDEATSINIAYLLRFLTDNVCKCQWKNCRGLHIITPSLVPIFGEWIPLASLSKFHTNYRFLWQKGYLKTYFM